MLKEHGYATCIAGKWQLGTEADAPQHFGFDESLLWQHTRPARNQKRDTRYANPQLELNAKPVDYNHGEYGPDVVTDFICDFMARNKAQPFLVYYPMILPHSPFPPTPDSKEPNSRNNQQNFQDMIAYVDKMVGKLDAELGELGVRENTLLLFTGDNGTARAIKSVLNGRPVQGGKGEMTDAGTRVPLVASWPGTIKQGQVLQDLVDFSDMLPTLCDAAGIPLPPQPGTDGRSFLPQLKGEEGHPRDWIYCWYSRGGGPNAEEWARNQRYKLYRTGELYDISQDVDEKSPLTGLSDEAKAIRATLQQALDQYQDARPAALSGTGKTPRQEPSKKKRGKRKGKGKGLSENTKNPNIPPIAAGSLKGAPDAKVKNILFLMSDDLKASVLGSYGNTVCKTPNLDRLAASGMVFERAYCQGLACAPSRPSMMRSIYPKSRATAPTIGEHLQKYEIYTARVGKIFHMPVPDAPKNGTSGQDVPECWTEYHNTKSEETYTPGLYRLMNKGVATREMKGRQGAGTSQRMFTSVEADQEDGSDQADYLVATKAIELLRERKAEGKPFFLGVGFFRPHYPLVAPKKFFDLYPQETLKIPPLIEGDLDDIPVAGQRVADQGLNDSEEGRRRMWQGYYASVTFMDEQLGRVLDELDRLGLRDSTAILFTSDHGLHLGEHGFWLKQNLHEEVARVPFIVSGPGVKPGRTSSLVELVDFYPTCTDLLGLPAPEGLQGLSLLPVLRNPDATVRDTALSIHNGKVAGGIRAATWHYMNYGGKGEELYDMDKDPHQFTNLVNDPASADLLEKAREQYQQRIADASIQWQK
jgi:arylsulfatase A-like enzyme